MRRRASVDTIDLVSLSHIGAGVALQREGYGFTPSELAHLAGMAPERVHEIESGQTPTTWEIAALAGALAVDPAALWRGDVGKSPWRSTARFRAPSGVGELKPRDARLLARAAEVGRLVHRLREKLGDPLSPVVEARNVLAVEPSLDAWDHGYRLGKKARDRLFPKRQPIVSVEHLLEELGVHIARVDFETDDVLAASLYEPKAAPIIVLNQRAKRVRQALSRRAVLAHELCHLLHDGGEMDLLTLVSRQGESMPIEQRANGFAPSFIVPGGWLDLEVDDQNPRAYVLKTAEQWGLSFEGAVWHAKNAGRLSPAQADALLEHPDLVPEAGFEPLLTRRDPAELGLGVEPSPLARGLLSEVAMRAYQAEIITAGRAVEILTIQ